MKLLTQVHNFNVIAQKLSDTNMRVARNLQWGAAVAGVWGWSYQRSEILYL